VVALVLSLGILGLVAAGCGSSSDSSSSSAGGGGSTSGESGSGGETAGASIKVEPRTIGVVELIRQAPIDDKTDKMIEAAGDALGWTVKVSDAEGNPQKVATAMQTFVNEGVDGIILDSVDANLVRKQLTQAKQKGIPTIHTNSGTEESDLWDAAYTEDEKKMASILIEYIYETVEEPKIIDLKTSLNVAGVEREEGVQEVVQREGDKGEIIASQEVDLSDPVPNTTKATTDLLTAHPEANAIYAVFDNMGQPAVTAVKLKRSDAKVYNYFTTEQNVKNLEGDTALAAVADVDLAKTGAVAIDQMLSLFEKEKPIERDAMKQYPLKYQVFDKEDVEELGSAGEAFPIEETLAPFLEKWEGEYPG